MPGRILTASDDTTARLWDAQSGQELARLQHDGRVYQAQWNADETRILTASDDTTARLWDAQSGQELARLQHDGTVYQAQWNADETRILTASEDGTARVYLAPGLPLREYACRFAVRNLSNAEWQSYLPSEPYRKICAHLPLHPGFVDSIVDQHQREDGTIDVDSALADIRAALERSPPGDGDQEEEARETLAEILAPRLVDQVVDLDREGKIEDAMANINLAQQIDPGREIDSSTWNELCGMGSLWNHAATVMPACDRAVELEPKEGAIRANRGMARALTGDFDGALEDVRLFRAWLEEKEPDNTAQLENVAQIITELEAQRNPFTPEVLERGR